MQQGEHSEAARPGRKAKFNFNVARSSHQFDRWSWHDDEPSPLDQERVLDGQKMLHWSISKRSLARTRQETEGPPAMGHLCGFSPTNEILSPSTAQRPALVPT